MGLTNPSPKYSTKLVSVLIVVFLTQRCRRHYEITTPALDEHLSKANRSSTRTRIHYAARRMRRVTMSEASKTAQVIKEMNRYRVGIPGKSESRLSS